MDGVGKVSRAVGRYKAGRGGGGTGGALDWNKMEGGRNNIKIERKTSHEPSKREGQKPTYFSCLSQIPQIRTLKLC